jgi:hypothetical protein
MFIIAALASPSDTKKTQALLEAERQFQSKIASVYEEHNKKIAELYERLQMNEKSTKQQHENDDIRGQMNIDNLDD